MRRDADIRERKKARGSGRVTVVMLRSATGLAFMTAPATRAEADGFAEREVSFKTADGWQIAGSLSIPNAKSKTAGVVLVHGSRHEKDAYGQALPRLLNEQETATLRIDIRGRGASREPLRFNSMPPEQRRAVRLDVLAAVDYLSSQPGVDGRRIAIIAEQDSASPTVIACAKDRRVAAFVLLSGRLSRQAKDDIASARFPIFCLVSTEDRRGFKDMTDAYLASDHRLSRLRVFEGIGFGTTMFSAWQYEFPKEEPIEQMIGAWLAARLKEAAKAVTKRKTR